MEGQKEKNVNINPWYGNQKQVSILSIFYKQLFVYKVSVMRS